MDSSSLPSADGNKKKNFFFFFPKAGTTATGRDTPPLPWSLQAGRSLALEQEEKGKKCTHPVLVSLGRDAQVCHAILHRSPP